MNDVKQTSDGETPRRGNQTSEHKMAWCSILGTIGVVAAAIASGGIAGIPPAVVAVAGVVSIALTSAGYSVSRGMAKRRP